MAELSRTVRLRSRPEKVSIQTSAEPLDDQVVWYLDQFIGKERVDGNLAMAVLSTLDGDGPARLAAMLEQELGYTPKYDCARSLCLALDEYLDAPFADPELFQAGQPGPLGAAVATIVAGTEPSAAGQPGTESKSGREALVGQVLFSLFQQAHGGRDLCNPLEQQEQRVARIFGLEAAELAILSLLYTMSERPALAKYLDGLNIHGYRGCVASILGVSYGEVKNLFLATNRLVSMGFVVPDYYPPPYYALGDDLTELYRNPNSSPSFAQPLDDFIKDNDSQLFPLDSYPVPPISRDLFMAFLNGKAGHMLVHGEPGTGKTSFVASALRSSGRGAFVLRLLGSPTDHSPSHLRLRMAASLCSGSSSVLVIDEADDLLNTESEKAEKAAVTKAWLTEFMDGIQVPVVWISNDIFEMHEAIRRRFVYSLRFRGQTETQRCLLWQRLAGTCAIGSMLKDDDIRLLSKNFRVNASGIALTLRGLDQVARGGDLQGEPDIRHLSELLLRYQALVHGVEDRPGDTVVTPKRFVPEAVCTDVPLGRVIAGLRGVAQRIRTRIDLEAVGAPVPEEIREGTEAKLLFHGPPGTGKTAYAHYIARELGLPLVQKRASELLGMFVGQTEKQIAEVFAEAEAQGSLLFLDEVDSLLRDRRSAREGWERSQVNELLSRMEDYRGPLVCCTNFLEGLDHAVLRRFQWKIAFKPPEAAARLLLYRRYFTELAGEPDAVTEKRVLAMDELCPGDFAAVYRALAPFQSEGQGLAAEHAEIAGMLEAELRIRAAGRPRALGFAC